MILAFLKSNLIMSFLPSKLAVSCHIEKVVSAINLITSLDNEPPFYSFCIQIEAHAFSIHYVLLYAVRAWQTIL